MDWLFILMGLGLLAASMLDRRRYRRDVDPGVPLMDQPSAAHQASYIQGRYSAWALLVLAVLFIGTGLGGLIL